MNIRDFQEKLADLIAEGVDGKFLSSVQYTPEDTEEGIDIFLHDGTTFNIRIMPIVEVY